MITACIFDLDGVIVDTARYHFLAWKRLAGELGVNLTAEENEKLKGVSRMQSLDIILAMGNISLTKKQKEEYASRKNGWFVEYVEAMKPSEIYPGVKALIVSMRQKHLKVALASSSKNAPRVVELLGIQNLFDTIVDGSMIVDTKPDPEIFLLTANRLGTAASNCLVFEDAEAGVEAAHRAGMKCIGVGSTAQLGKAEAVVARTADFRIDELKKF